MQRNESKNSRGFFIYKRLKRLKQRRLFTSVLNAVQTIFPFNTTSYGHKHKGTQEKVSKLQQLSPRPLGALSTAPLNRETLKWLIEKVHDQTYLSEAKSALQF